MLLLNPRKVVLSIKKATISSVHRPHKFGNNVSGGALREGLLFLKTAIDEKKID